MRAEPKRAGAIAWVGTLILGLPFLVGCETKAAKELGAGNERTSGGEEVSSRDALDGGGDPKEGTPSTAEGESTPAAGAAATPNDGTKPKTSWGQTREEQCQPPPRRPVTGSAQQAIAQGLQAASTGNAAVARASFQQALSADRNAYPAAYGLGVLADRAGQETQALEYYRQALRLQPDYESAAAGMVAILTRRSPNEALAFIEPLAAKYPTNLSLQALHAEVLVAAQRHDKVWEAARRALRCDERFVPAMIPLVKASLKQGRLELASAILDQAIEIAPNHAELRYLKGRMLLDEDGRTRDALAELRKAVELRPDYLEARMTLGIQLLGGANYDEALRNLLVAAQLAPKSVAVHLNLGDAHRALRRWQEAKAEFDTALSLRPNLPEAHFNLALLYMTAGSEFPGMDQLAALQKAVQEFRRYRELMGPRLPRDDASEGYLKDLERQIEREQKRIEREKARAQREAERAPRQDPNGGR